MLCIKSVNPAMPLVGQTGRKLKARLDEHRNHFNSNSNNQLVINIEFEHNFGLGECRDIR